MPFYEGLFLAPVTVANAVKGTVLASIALELMGFEVKPSPKVLPKDVICSIKFNYYYYFNMFKFFSACFLGVDYDRKFHRRDGA